MKALFFVVCVLLASSLFIPTSTTARELVEKEGALASGKPPLTGGTGNRNGRQGKACDKGNQYARCVINPTPRKCHPNEKNCGSHPAAAP
ncbi:hypothetical protein PTKIN_Ptkin14bG0102300 [Pterospermum kingtungense]